MDFGKIFNQVLDVAKDSVLNTKNGQSTQDKIAKVGGGAAALGVLSMILGRNGGANLAKLGSLAALGSLAYKAYQDYQAKQQLSADVAEDRFVAVADDSGKVVLQAMIAAAAADGVISEEEKQAITAEAGSDPEVQLWLQRELQQPASVEEIANAVAGNEALAAQVYLAARMVCQDLARKEIVFLANLAEALGLSDSFVEELEKQAGF